MIPRYSTPSSSASVFLILTSISYNDCELNGINWFDDNHTSSLPLSFPSCNALSPNISSPFFTNDFSPSPPASNWWYPCPEPSVFGLSPLLVKSVIEGYWEKSSKKIVVNPLSPLTSTSSPILIEPVIRPPSNNTLEADNCPFALTLKLLADMISSSGVIDEDKTKWLLEIAVVPKTNPPIEPLSVLICVAVTSPLNCPDVAVILPVKSTLDAVMFPFFKWTLEALISTSPLAASIKFVLPCPKNTDGEAIVTSEPLMSTFEDVICKEEFSNLTPTEPLPI